MFTDRPGMYPMTEEQIERHVERKMNGLDARLMTGSMSQSDYDMATRELGQWADAEYRYSHTSLTRRHY